MKFISQVGTSAVINTRKEKKNDIFYLKSFNYFYESSNYKVNTNKLFILSLQMDTKLGKQMISARKYISYKMKVMYKSIVYDYCQNYVIIRPLKLRHLCLERFFPCSKYYFLFFTGNPISTFEQRNVQVLKVPIAKYRGGAKLETLEVHYS